MSAANPRRIESWPEAAGALSSALRMVLYPDPDNSNPAVTRRTAIAVLDEYDGFIERRLVERAVSR